MVFNPKATFFTYNQYGLCVTCNSKLFCVNGIRSRFTHKHKPFVVPILSKIHSYSLIYMINMWLYPVQPVIMRHPHWYADQQLSEAPWAILQPFLIAIIKLTLCSGICYMNVQLDWSAYLVVCYHVFSYYSYLPNGCHWGREPALKDKIR